MKTFRIHFIRHGLTEGNAQGKYIGVTDLPLSENGADELERIRLKGELPEADMVFSSPLKRCLESCEILFPNKAPVIIDEFKEFNFGDFENKTALELDGTYEYTEWIAGRATLPNGEDSTEFVKRICQGLNKAIRKMMEAEVSEAIAVMHGGVMMSLFQACALPQRRAVEWASPVGQGFTALITPSLYGKTGAIEIIDTVPSTAFVTDEY